MKINIKYAKGAIQLTLSRNDNEIKDRLIAKGWESTNSRDFFQSISYANNVGTANATLNLYAGFVDLNISAVDVYLSEKLVELDFTKKTDRYYQLHNDAVLPTNPVAPVVPTDPGDVDFSTVVKLNSDVTQNIYGGLRIDKVQRWNRERSMLGITHRFKPTYEAAIKSDGWHTDVDLFCGGDAGLNGLSKEVNVVAIPEELDSPDDIEDGNIRKIYFKIVKFYRFSSIYSFQVEDEDIIDKLEIYFNYERSDNSGRPRFFILDHEYTDASPARMKDALHFDNRGAAVSLQRGGDIVDGGKSTSMAQRGTNTVGVSLGNEFRTPGLYFYFGNGDPTAYKLMYYGVTSMQFYPDAKEKVHYNTRLYFNMPTADVNDPTRVKATVDYSIMPLSRRKSIFTGIYADVEKGSSEIGLKRTLSIDLIAIGDIMRITRCGVAGYDDYVICKTPGAGTTVGMDEPLRASITSNDGVVFYTPQDYEDLSDGKEIDKGLLRRVLSKYEIKDSELKADIDTIVANMTKSVKKDIENIMSAAILTPISELAHNGFAAVPAPIYNNILDQSFPMLNGEKRYAGFLNSDGSVADGSIAPLVRMSAFGATAPTTTNSFYMFSKSGASQFCFSSSATSVLPISAEVEAEIKPLLNANGLFWVQIVGVDVSDPRALLPRGVIESLIIA